MSLLLVARPGAPNVASLLLTSKLLTSVSTLPQQCCDKRIKTHRSPGNPSDLHRMAWKAENVTLASNLVGAFFNEKRPQLHLGCRNEAAPNDTRKRFRPILQRPKPLPCSAPGDRCSAAALWPASCLSRGWSNLRSCKTKASASLSRQLRVEASK